MPRKGEAHPHRGCTYEERYGIERAKTIKATLKARLALRGDSYRIAMSMAKRGEIRSPETRHKIRLAKLGQAHSCEHRRKNSEAHLGKKTGPHSTQRIWNQRFALLARAMTSGGYKQWERRDRRNGGQYRPWRRAVLALHGRVCYGCGEASERLDIHHLLSWERFPELRYRTENGLPLCTVCHVIANALQKRLESLLWPKHVDDRPRLVAP